MSLDRARIGVVGATGAVGGVLLDILRERSYNDVKLFASGRSAGRELDGRIVEEATPDTLSAGGVDVFFFAVGASASRELAPHAVRGGAVVLDKSSGWRMEPDVPLVVPEVNGARALEHNGIIAVPNCSTIPLTVVLKPLHDEAGLARVRVATYQSASGAGLKRMEELRAQTAAEHDLGMDWDFDGEEFDEETKIREETRKIMELPDLPVSATCVRVPVLVGHSEAVWIETQRPLSAERARELLEAAPGVRVEEFPTPGKAAGQDDVLVGRIRPDRAGEGLSLFLVGDNLRKGAALNAVQVAELVLAEASRRRLRARYRHRLRGREDLAQPSQHRRTAAGEHRLQPAEVQPKELHPACAAQRAEAQISEKVAREHRAVDEEALVHRLPLAIRVRERLQRGCAPVSRVADRCEEQRLHHPRGRRIGEIGAGDEHSVLRGRARRQLGRPREERRGAVLHRPEQMAVAVHVQRPPRSPLRLRPLAPAVFLRNRPRPRLPPHALVADGGRPLQRGAGHADDLGRHLFPDLVDDHVHSGGRGSRHPFEVLGDARLKVASERRDRQAGLDAHVNLDGDVVLAADADTVVAP